MKKYIVIFSITFTIALSFMNIKAHASTALNVSDLVSGNNYKCIFWINTTSYTEDPPNDWYYYSYFLVCCYDENPSVNFNNGVCYINSRCYVYYQFFANKNYGKIPTNSEVIYYDNSSSGNGYNYSVRNTQLIVIKGTPFVTNGTYISYDEWANPEVPWYEDAWNIFKGWLNNTPWDDFHPIEAIKNFWNNIINGNNDPDDINILNFASPTPTPTRTPLPTPIPYTTSLVTNGNETTIIYNYVNPQGTPTSSPYNPNTSYNIDFAYNNNTVINNGGSDTNTTLLVTGAPPYFQDIIYGSDDISINSLGDYSDVIENGIKGKEQGLKFISDAFSVIPMDWFMLLGAIACIPILASIISRMLH